MSQWPKQHICWGKEPWFAWDLWNQVSGESELFHAMLNGCYAKVPVLLQLDFDGREQNLIVPDVVDLFPVIGDYLPVTTECGLWVAHTAEQHVELNQSNGYGLPYEAVVSPRNTEMEYVDGEGEGLLHRPWNVEFLLDATDDNCAEYNEADDWLRRNIIDFDDGDHFELEEIERISAEFLDFQRQERQEWFHFLSAMAPRHECAGLMLDELSKEIAR